MRSSSLAKFHILLVDHDLELAKVFRHMLMEMGFKHVEVTRSGADALGQMQTQPIDFLITDWTTQDLGGFELLRSIRRSSLSPNPVLPIIMLSGRSEIGDVRAARDAGINEYIIKPFSANSVYNRLERLIEYPRPFIVTKDFVGPERRMHDFKTDRTERRQASLSPQLQPHDMVGAIHSIRGPELWLPDFSLKYKLGSKLNTLITPEVLQAAQLALQSQSDASLQWVVDDLHHLQSLAGVLRSDQPADYVKHELTETSLTIHNRTGTFGYERASEIAYMLYKFCRDALNIMLQEHRIVVDKHVEVLQVILGNRMRGSAGALGQTITRELQVLTAKYS